MTSWKKKNRHKNSGGSASPVRFDSSVLQSIRQHARGTPNMEICGALIGRQSDAGTFVVGAVPGDGAAQGGAHVTFTQQAWVRIHEEKDKRYPDQAIVGWYHSHPGFGVFLSDHDTFIHKNFFATPGSLAWVYDPHSDEEGCFGWNGGEIRRLSRFEVVTSADKRNDQKDEPSAHTHSKHVKAPPKSASWRRSRMARAVLLMAFVVLMGLAGWGTWLILQDAPMLHQFCDWFKRGRTDRQTQSAPSGNPMESKNPTSTKNTSSSANASRVGSPQDGENKSK